MFIRVLAGLFGSPVTLEFPQESTPAKPLRPVSYKALSNIRLRPPTQEAMEAAMKFLLASIAEENAGEAERYVDVLFHVEGQLFTTIQWDKSSSEGTPIV